MYDHRQQWQQDRLECHFIKALSSMARIISREDSLMLLDFFFPTSFQDLFSLPLCGSAFDKPRTTPPPRVAAHWWHNRASPMLMLKAKSLSFIFPPSAPLQPPHCIFPDRMARSKQPQARDTNRVKASHLKSVTPEGIKTSLITRRKRNPLS